MKVFFLSTLFMLVGFNSFANETQLNLATITENNVQQSWQNFVEAQSNFISKNNAYPWQEVLDLNILSARTWSMMIDCEGSTDESINSIQVKYKNNDVFCNSQVNANLQQLHDSMILLLSSADVSVDLEQERDLLKTDIYPILHPLFTQVLLEMVSVTIPPFISDWSSPEANHHEKILKNISKIDSYEKHAQLEKHFNALQIINTLMALRDQPQQQDEVSGLWQKKTFSLLNFDFSHSLTHQFYQDIGKTYGYRTYEEASSKVKR